MIIGCSSSIYLVDHLYLYWRCLANIFLCFIWCLAVLFFVLFARQFDCSLSVLMAIICFIWDLEYALLVVYLFIEYCWLFEFFISYFHFLWFNFYPILHRSIHIFNYCPHCFSIPEYYFMRIDYFRREQFAFKNYFLRIRLIFL